MRYLLDTNVCVDYLRGRHAPLVRRIQEASPQNLCVSTVVVAELWYGAEKSTRQRDNHERIDQLVEEMTVLPFDLQAAATFGRIRRELERRGTVIGPYDMLIAAHALATGLIVVTDNEEEFRRVTGLGVENWSRNP